MDTGIKHTFFSDRGRRKVENANINFVKRMAISIAAGQMFIGSSGCVAGLFLYCPLKQALNLSFSDEGKICIHNNVVICYLTFEVKVEKIVLSHGLKPMT